MLAFVLVMQIVCYMYVVQMLSFGMYGFGDVWGVGEL